MRLDLNSNEDCQSFEPIIKKIKLENLSSWGGLEKTDTRIPITDYSTLGAPGYSSTPFYQSKDVNNRFVIWDGDITTLEVDAITNSADASLTANNPISKRIFAGAGIQLKDEINKNKKECQISEVQITKAYDLPAKYILHAVGPTCNEKLNSSAEKSLYCCYRNVLSRARELNLRTIALCVISQNIFAADLEAHIALRTTRHYLDNYTSQIVILCVPPQQRGIYEVLAPLYFPRDQLEERTALWHLPKDIAFDFSDTHHPDRQIRIIRNPQHSVMMRNTDDESDNCPHDVEDGGSDLEYGVSDLNGLNMSSNSVGSQSYRQMQGDLDRQLLLGDRPRNGIYEGLISEGVEGLEHQETYERLLRRAQVEDLNEISGIGCLYQSGIDRLGRPVIVFCGKWFPAHNIDLEKALLYLIKLLDPIVKGDYVITYFHTLTSANNYPSLQWLREVYSVLPYKYKKNLKAFYIVHPTFWTKMMTWWFTTFMAPAIKAKVHSLPGVEHLYSAISKDQLEIPAYITEYDMATNGLHYFTPLHTTS